MAVLSAIRRSQATASWLPPPMQWPRILATVGTGRLRSACSAVSTTARMVAPSSDSEPISAPAQKEGLDPVSTTAHSSGSAARSAQIAASRRHMSAVSALRFPARSMVMVPTPSWLCTRKPA